MATKIQLYSQLAEQQLEQVTSGLESWKGFLNTASRLYRYSFADQLMIHAQRPDATACAPIETWNSPMNRWVRRGSKGIALLDDTGSRPGLRYVFDLSDTEPAGANALIPFLWELKEEHHLPVLEYLAKTYEGIADNLVDAVYNIAFQLSKEYYRDNIQEIKYITEGSFLEDYDELNLRVTFLEALTASVAYSLMARCGLDTDTYLEPEAFQSVFQFNTPAAVTALGTAVSDLSEQVLKDIGAVIKKYERQKAAERSAEYEQGDQNRQQSDLQPGRGLSDSQPDSYGTDLTSDGGSHRQIRTDEKELPETTPDHDVQHAIITGEAVSPPEGNRTGSEPENGAVYEGTDREEPASGQGNGSDGLGEPYEQSESSGRGDRGERTDLQLNEEQEEIPSGQEVLAPDGISLSVEESITETYSQPGNRSDEQEASDSAMVPSLAETLTDTFLSTAELDAVLRDGGNERKSLLHIIAYFLKGKTAAENAEFLAREYMRGGKGFQFGEKQIAVWFDKTGLTFGHGETALQSKAPVHITWDQAAVRIRELMDEGQYASSDDVFDEAIDNEHRELAGRLLFFYRDDLRGYREMPEAWQAKKGGFPDDAALVKELLLDKTELGEYQRIRERLEEDIAALLTDPDAPKRRWHDPIRLLEDVQNLGIPPRSFPAGEMKSIGFLPFITEDEVDDYLVRGSSFQEGKYRIMSYFLHDHNLKERADFLKGEYGEGGQSHALSGADNSWADSSPGKGIRLVRGGLSNPYDTVKLSWSAAEKRIGSLIQHGRYMIRAELERIHDYEKDMLTRHVVNFYYNMPEEIERPYPSSHDIFDAEGRRAVRTMLDDPAKVTEILASMKPVYEGTHEDDRYYATRKNGYESLLAYQNGTYNLFPGIENLSEPEAVTVRQQNTEPVSKPYTQLTLFDLPLPILPGVEEQRAVIEEKTQKEVLPAPAVTNTFSQEEIDTLLLGAIETVEQYGHIHSVFSENYRSKEAVQLIKDSYYGIHFMPRIDGAEGYMCLLGENTGVTLSKGDPQTVPLAERNPAITLDLSWAKVHRRVAELAQAGDLQKAKDQSHVFFSPNQLISYSIGDTVDALSADNIHVLMDISRVDKDYVYYTLASEPGQEPVEMFRFRFEGYLEAGRFTVLGHGETIVLREIYEREPEPFQRPVQEEDIVKQSEESENHSELQSSNEELQEEKALPESSQIEPEPKTPPIPQEPLERELGGGFFILQTKRHTYSDEERTAARAAIDPDLLAILTDDQFMDEDQRRNTAALLAGGILKHAAPDYFRQIHYRAQNNFILPDGRQAKYQADNRGIFFTPNLNVAKLNVLDNSYENNLAILDFEGGRLFTWAQTVNAILLLCEYQLEGFVISHVDREAERTEKDTIVSEIQEPEKEHIPPTEQEATAPLEEEPEPEINQADIDEALIRWNGSLDSKILVYQYMQQNPRARETAVFLREEFGGDLPAFLVTKENAEPVNLSWPVVQRNIGRLMDAQAFLTAEEQTDAEHEYTDFVNEELPDLDEQEPEQTIQDIMPPKNYRITDDHLGEGGPKTKFGYNLMAIRTLKQVEAENRYATPGEQEILSCYSGWGGIPQAFDPGQEGWRREYTELKELLTESEYAKARASVLNAYYTPPVMIKAIYDAMKQMGFKQGNILEPSCATGKFFGLLPEEMKGSKLYGVELDDISGRIAGLLYPDAFIQVKGFEDTGFADDSFDLVIGNVPFGDYKVHDPRYNKHNFLIHDYFIAKSIDKVRAGGMLALITSNGIGGGTMDKRETKIRRHMAERCDLIGAIRLPDNAFRSAGTDVTTDILFLQKREVPRILGENALDWINTSVLQESEHVNRNGEKRRNIVTVNPYFQEHPEMVLGELKIVSGAFGPELNCISNGTDLGEQLHDAIIHLKGQITEAEIEDIEGVQEESIPADPTVRNFSYTVVDDRVYYRENSSMYPVDLPAVTLDRIRGMVELRNCVHELINLQMEEYGDTQIKAKQAQLNSLYDAFTAEYGLINSTGNSRAFSADSAYFLLCSLEILDEDGNLARKADMFTKRTIKQKTVITSVDTASEALAVSIGERACVDLEFMQQLTGFTKSRLIIDLMGVIFRDLGDQPVENIPKAFYDPEKLPFVTADEYLSGNVRNKLHLAKAVAEMYPEFAGQIVPNIEALEKAQPKDLDASEISVRLGSTWVDKEYVQHFMFELLQPSYNLRNTLKVNYFEYTGEWQVAGKARVPYNNILATVTYGTERMNAYQILDDTLNLRDVRVYDTIIEDGKERRILNKRETTLAQQKQEAIKQAFKDWIWKDPVRRQTLVRKYNDKFNSSRLREYDGSHINFFGMSPDITLRIHQLNAIAHILYGGNTLLAHEVGAGKTFEMVAAAMESKRLGLCQKSLFAVPNHLTEQWAAEFLRLYPSANILVATKKDFEMRNRKKFCAKIATGDYDAVIIGHSQLEKIPMSMERQERLLQDQIWEVIQGIDEMKRSRSENFTIKQLEKTRKSLETKLKKLLEGKQRDDVVTFEQLGVDRLFIDESHFFKNLFLYTKMRNVAGLSTSDAQKSSDLFMKCLYMDELTGKKGIIFATGTPISNSMTEMYTIQRYLQYDLLAKKNLTHFDAWASTFGETVTAIELAPEGTGYRARTRFSKFHNLPELMAMFKEVADIKTADTMDLPRPKANYETVVVKPTELQQEMVKELSDRAAAVHANRVDPTIDNMLKITADGRKIGLDQRLMNSMLPDDESSKVNTCARNIYEIWQETKSDHLAQLAFCDFSTPNKDGRFNVYDDIRDKLITRGIPAEEIAFIHEANTEVRKKELFAKVRLGKVRILFGSTFKMGAGTNVQDKLIALHDLDCPWRPSDLEQRSGRIVRQGNKNPEVFIYRYATEGTFDSYLWQTVENKQRFISQIMTSKSPVRACEDVDETSLSYAEIKALCAGNPLIKEKIDLDIEVARLRLLRADHQSQHYRLEDDLLKYYPENIEAAKNRIAGAGKDLERYNTNLPKAPAIQLEAAAESETAISGENIPAAPLFPTMTLLDIEYTEKETAAKALLEACKTIVEKEPAKIGSYLGFDMILIYDSFFKRFNLTLKGDLSYSVEIGTDTFGNMTRINNTMRTEIPDRLSSSKNQLENLYQQVEDAKKELKNPFAQEQELISKETRLAFLNAQLNIDSGSESVAVVAESELRQVAYAKSAKLSILETLRSGMIGGKSKNNPDKTKRGDVTV